MIFWGIVIIIVLVLLLGDSDRGSQDSLNDNRVYGRYRVRYPDGNYSQPFFYEVAKDYAHMFGGDVVKFK